MTNNEFTVKIMQELANISYAIEHLAGTLDDTNRRLTMIDANTGRTAGHLEGISEPLENLSKTATKIEREFTYMNRT